MPPVNPSRPSHTPANQVCETCPKCKVEVGAFRVTKAGGNHLFIRYTRQDGSVWFYRGGPQSGNRFSNDVSVTEFNPANAEITDKTTSQGRDEPLSVWNPARMWNNEARNLEVNLNPWGPIITHYGKWQGSIEKELYNNKGSGMITIAEGAQHCHYHPIFVKTLENIAALNIDYDMDGPNSNSVVRTLLRDAGLAESKPGVWCPGWGTYLFE